MEFEPTFTVGNLFVAFSIIISSIAAVISFKTRLDYLANEFNRLATTIEKMDDILRSHERHINIILTKLGDHD
jgi:TM2 domain-containing membrane protein YozV